VDRLSGSRERSIELVALKLILLGFHVGDDHHLGFQTLEGVNCAIPDRIDKGLPCGRHLERMLMKISRDALVVIDQGKDDNITIIIS
jgi:hypothetical protein